MPLLVASVVFSSLACGAAPPTTTELPDMRVAAHSRAEAESCDARRARLASAMLDVESMVTDRLAALAIPGAAVAVLDRGQLLWAREYGVRDLKQPDPVTRHTVFRIGSITKTMTAMAFLVLRDADRIALDAPAARFLPELEGIIYPTADSPRITLRHLLTHTSGLPRVGRFDYASARQTPVSESEILAAIRGLRLEYAPGIKNQYSNLG
jgi:CubicO group peptidase (beta-lactamase class C family)